MPNKFVVVQIALGPYDTEPPADITDGFRVLARTLQGNADRLGLDGVTAVQFVTDPEEQRSSLVDVLTFHTRDVDGGCACGWNPGGEPWAEHVTDVFYESSIARTGM